MNVIATIESIPLELLSELEPLSLIGVNRYLTDAVNQMIYRITSKYPTYHYRNKFSVIAPSAAAFMVPRLTRWNGPIMLARVLMRAKNMPAFERLVDLKLATHPRSFHAVNYAFDHKYYDAISVMFARIPARRPHIVRVAVRDEHHEVVDGILKTNISLDMETVSELIIGADKRQDLFRTLLVQIARTGNIGAEVVLAKVPNLLNDNKIIDLAFDMGFPWLVTRLYAILTRDCFAHMLCRCAAIGNIDIILHVYKESKYTNIDSELFARLANCAGEAGERETTKMLNILTTMSKPTP
jgi:hypothetical protein